MRLHPQIEKALQALAEANLPPLHTLSPGAARDQMDAMVRARGGVPAPIDRSEDRTIPGPAGEVPARIYWPKAEDAGPEGSRGAVLYLHGGGFVIGGLDSHDTICRNLCAGAGAVVVSVDYRMGPEHKFPAAVDDCWAGLRWLAENAHTLGADPACLAVAGDSAGGNLAAVVALLARDAGAPALKAQVLIYPVADCTFATESYTQFAEGYGVLTRNAMEWFVDHYVSGPPDVGDWRASPIRAASFEGVAPAIVVVAECDVLRDDGNAIADALRKASVPVEHLFYPGMIHGFFGMAPDVDDAITAQAQVCHSLRQALGG